MVDKAVTYDELLSEVLESMGIVNLPSPADRWVELVDLVAEGKRRGRSDAQVRKAIEKAVEAGTHERQKHGRRIFYRVVADAIQDVVYNSGIEYWKV